MIRKLTAKQATDLLTWMRRVGHVGREEAADLYAKGRLTDAHAAYFRDARTGVSLEAFLGKKRHADLRAWLLVAHGG